MPDGSDLEAVREGVVRRARRVVRTPGSNSAEIEDLRERIERLEEDIAENRRLNERLSDVLDVVAELLVPAVDRDDARLKEALRHLGKSVPE